MMNLSNNNFKDDFEKIVNPLIQKNIKIMQWIPLTVQLTT